MPNRNAFIGKIKEAAASVLPIVLIVAVLCLIWIPMQNDLMLAFLIGAVLLIAGMGLFTVGSDLSMSQIGSHIGARLTRSRNVPLILTVSFLLGAAVTIAEPDLQVLAKNVPSINSTLLILVVSAGVGVFLLLSMARILFSLPMHWLLTASYGVVFLLSFLEDPNFLSVAFDAGGVTTGPMTVPFIMALGVGVASIRSDEKAQQDSFGLVGLSSVGPILAVLLLGFLCRPDAGGEAENYLKSYQDTVALGHGYLSAIPGVLREVGMALLPIAVFFLLFQLITLKLKKIPLLRIAMGMVMTMLGLLLFLTGVNVGFSPLGYLLGAQLAGSAQRLVLVPLSMLMGWFIINAEPAVHVLNKQVEELSAGAISSRAMGLSLSIAVSSAMGLSMLRVLYGIPILWVLLPGYAVAVGLSFLVPRTFTAIAFDSGGVASGPLTAAFMLPFAMGAVNAAGGNPMTDAFGLVALVALMPLITVQIMGVISVVSARRSAGREAPVFEDFSVIELWED